MVILCTIDLETREVSLPAGQVIASYDHNVDVIRFQAEPIEDFSLDTSSIKIAAQGPNKARHDYSVDPSTVAIEEETGYITFDWPIPAGVTEMPLDVFKYGDKGNLIFAVCAEIINGSTVSKAWHSDDGIITVVAHLEPESGGGEDPEEEATNAQKIAQLQTNVAVMGTQIGALANGSPTPVSTVAEMTDESAVYLYTGSETGYTAGNWYYNNGSAWTFGGQYGGAVTDTTLSISGAPADAKAVGDALALKADTDTVEAEITALDERVAVVEEYADIFTADVDESVQNWLDEHPEATTTVEDGSITESKLSDALKTKTVNGYVTPEMYGAKGDGETDDSEAIQKMLNEAPLNSVCIFNNDYYCASGLLVTRAINVYMYGKCIFPNTLEYGFRVYGHGAKRNTFRVNLECYGVQDTWENQNIIGLDLWACQDNTFDVYCQGFKTGIRLLAGNTNNEVDCDYNKIFIRTIYNCQYAIWMDGLTGESPLNGGTVSQNTFIGGHIGVQGASYAWLGAEDTADNSYWAVRSDLKASRTNNNNTFVAVSFEGFGAKASPYENRAKVTLDFAYGMYLNCRYENMTSFNKTATGIVPSMVIGGYGAEDLYTDDIYHVGNRKTILRPYGNPVVIQRAGNGDRFLEVKNANNVLISVLEGKNFYVPTLNLLPNGNPYGSSAPANSIKMLLEYSYGNAADTMSHIGNGEWRITNFGHIVSKKRDGSKTYDIQPIYTDVSGINPITGTMAFVNGKPQWYDGTQWVDATGQPVT